MAHPVCIVDDDDDIREVITYALEFEGIPTISFNSALSAEQYLNTLGPNLWPCLLILDYFMPEVNGIEFISILRSKYPETLGKIPVALSTAHFMENSDLLPDEVLVLQKPYDLDTLLATAKSYFERGQVSSALN